MESQDAQQDHAATELLICVKCRRNREVGDDARRPGEVLFDALDAQPLPAGVRLTPVDCLQNCDHGCSVALRGGAQKWIYVFANIDETQHAEMLLDGALAYHATPDGLIPWRARPEHFKRNCVARIPPMTLNKDSQHD